MDMTSTFVTHQEFARFLPRLRHEQKRHHEGAPGTPRRVSALLGFTISAIRAGSQHLAERAAFVLVSGDAPSVQRKFAADRGWRFPMVSCQGNTFSADMGHSSPDEPVSPGVTVFQRRGDEIVRVSDAEFGPFDDFCTVYHFIDLLPDGTNGFRPRFRYFGP